MALRVTQGMMSMQLLRNLGASMKRMDKMQEQMSTGRKINRPSDDPVGITYALRYRSEISANDQYQKNVDTAKSWLDYQDTLMTETMNIMQRVRELTVKGANGTNPQAALDAIRQEIGQLKNQLVDIGNSRLNGKYVFNGQKTDVKPYDPASTAADAVTDGYNVELELSAGIKVPVNVTGNQFFGRKGEADNVFAILDQLSSDLAAGNTAGLNAALGKMDTRVDKMLSLQAEIGARSNRVDLIGNRLQDLGLNLTNLQSKTEDADYSRLIIQSKVNENIYEASLSVGAKIISPSLVDFLK
jgi:flagellar hook-associated protein 3 FlgL